MTTEFQLTEVILGLSIIFLGGAFIYQQRQLNKLRTSTLHQSDHILWCTEQIGKLMPGGEHHGS